MRVAVVVLGELGRSPRMCYHGLSLCGMASVSSVSMVGYRGVGVEVRKELKEHPKVKMYELENSTNNMPAWINSIFLFRIVWKVLFQLWSFVWLLWQMPRPDYYLVQTPPFIPIVPLVLLVAFFRRSKVIIDWHNFGNTILSTTIQAANKNKRENLSVTQRLSVAVYKWCERIFGKFSHGNLCVTKAMQTYLVNEWGIRANVLYDRAPSFFKRLSVSEKHKLFLEIQQEINAHIPKGWVDLSNSNDITESTIFTQQSKDGSIVERDHRPLLLVSSTSWTDDEDFDILLDALLELDQQLQTLTSPPKFLVIITGKGQNRDKYVAQIQTMGLRNIRIITMWLKAEQYPKLLGAADFGISLHNSSSGYDLPMKVVDMFGAQLPVAAINFNCLGELVQDNKNGVIFNDSKELCSHLFNLFGKQPFNNPKLEYMRNEVSSFQKVRWEDNWNEIVRPMLV